MVDPHRFIRLQATSDSRIPLALTDGIGMLDLIAIQRERGAIRAPTTVAQPKHRARPASPPPQRQQQAPPPMAPQASVPHVSTEPRAVVVPVDEVSSPLPPQAQAQAQAQRAPTGEESDSDSSDSSDSGECEPPDWVSEFTQAPPTSLGRCHRSDECRGKYVCHRHQRAYQTMKKASEPGLVPSPSPMRPQPPPLAAVNQVRGVENTKFRDAIIIQEMEVLRPPPQRSEAL
jgi:hypothetical protein